MTQQSELPTVFYVLLPLAVISFALSPILVRLTGDVPGMAIAVWRTLFSVLLLLPFAWRRAREEIRQFSWRDRIFVLLAGVFLGLHFIAWIESLFYTTVASASVLVTTSPIFLVLFGFLFLGERLSKGVVLAIVVAVGGSVLISLTGDATGSQALNPRPVLGNGLALFASLLASAYLLVGRVVRRGISWPAYVLPLYGVAALTTLAAALLMEVQLWGFEPVFYLLCLAMAIFPQLIGHGTFNYALAYLPAALVSLLALLEPVGASIMAYFLFNEVPTSIAMIGMAVVLAALAVIVLLRRRRRLEDKRQPESS